MRFRLTPALVVGAMVNGTIEKNVDEDSNLMLGYLRQPNLLPHVEVKKVKALPGCQSAGCRTLGKCLCTCRRCKKECLKELDQFNLVASLKE